MHILVQYLLTTLVCFGHEDSVNRIINQIFLFKQSVWKLAAKFTVHLLQRCGPFYGLHFSTEFSSFLVHFMSLSLFCFFFVAFFLKRVCLFIFYPYKPLEILSERSEGKCKKSSCYVAVTGTPLCSARGKEDKERKEAGKQTRKEERKRHDIAPALEKLGEWGPRALGTVHSDSSPFWTLTALRLDNTQFSTWMMDSLVLSACCFRWRSIAFWAGTLY